MRIVLSVLIAGVLLLGVALLPGPEPVPIPPETVALRTVCAYLEAARDGRTRDAWNLLAEPAKDFYRELHSGGRGTWMNHDLLPMAESMNATSYDRPEDLFAAELLSEPDRGSLLEVVRGEKPEIVIEGDFATLTWGEADLRIVLEREDGRWRYLIRGTTSGALEMAELDSGRTIAVWTWFDMVRKDKPEMDRWEKLLPVIRGPRPDTEDEYNCPHRKIELFVDGIGRVLYHHDEIAPADLHEMLFVHADSDRDYIDDGQPSLVRAETWLDREMGWTAFRELLLALTDATVRIRNVQIPVRFGGPESPREYSDIVTLRVSFAWYSGQRIRMEEPAFELVLSDLPESPAGPDLVETLSAADRKTRRASVRLRVGKGVQVGRIVPVLIALGQVESLRVILDVREADAAPEVVAGVDLDGRGVSLHPFEGPFAPEVEVELWRP